MEPTRTVPTRSRGRWLILFGLLVSALTLSGIAASPALADEGGTDSAAEEEFEYFLSGNVQFEDEPLEGVEISAEGNGFEASTETDADGRWSIPNVLIGAYEIEVFNAFYGERVFRGALLAHGETHDLDVLYGQSGSVEGTVVDHDGVTPAAGGRS